MDGAGSGLPRVAAIIPLHNGAPFIAEAVQSVLSQTEVPDEIVVVDDGSTDDGAAIVREIKHPAIKVLQKVQGGQSSARNIGAKETTAELLAYLDQDDIWLPRHIEILKDAFLSERTQSLGWVYSDVDLVDADGGLLALSFLTSTNAGEEHPKRTLEACLRSNLMVWASASLISREAFTNIGGFDENLSGYEDDDFWLRVFRAGYGNAFIPTALTRVRRHVNSCGRSSNMQRSRIIYARKLLEAFPDKPEMGQYFASKLIAPRFINLELRDFRAARRQGDAAAMALYLERLKSFEAYLTADTAKLISKVTKVPGWDDRLPSRKPKTRQIENKAVDRGDDVFQSLPVEPHRPITSDDVFAALQASLWEVRHPVVSACDEHFPFLFALVALVRPRTYVELGVHRGGSFFAVCQAVERLQLDATCIAIDNWIGDHHAGMHSEDVFDAFTDTLDQYYASFAGYIRRPFDLAAHQFELGSIDILHIDGFHSFEAVKKDFETWFDKLSDQGVVLFHDTNEFKSDFGVWRFWEQVSERYPSMEFGHGHGLGVLVVGEKSPLRNNVEGWSASLISGESVDLMRVLFSGLGRTSSKLSAHRRKRNSKSSERDEARIKMLEKTIASMKRSLSFRITAPLRTLKRKFRG